MVQEYILSGASGTISATNSISVGMDQGLVIDGNKKTINGLSNTTWDPEKLCFRSGCNRRPVTGSSSSF